MSEAHHIWSRGEEQPIDAATSFGSVVDAKPGAYAACIGDEGVGVVAVCLQIEVRSGIQGQACNHDVGEGRQLKRKR